MEVRQIRPACSPARPVRPDVGRARAQANVAARHEMVRIIELQAAMLSGETGIEQLDPRVLEAMREVPRHAFVPEPLRYAYGDHPLPVTADQNLAAPLWPRCWPTSPRSRRGRGVPDRYGRRLSGGAAIGPRGRVYSVELVSRLPIKPPGCSRNCTMTTSTCRRATAISAGPSTPYDAMIIKEAIDHVPPPPRAAQARRSHRAAARTGARAHST